MACSATLRNYLRHKSAASRKQHTSKDLHPYVDQTSDPSFRQSLVWETEVGRVEKLDYFAASTYFDTDVVQPRLYQEITLEQLNSFSFTCKFSTQACYDPISHHLLSSSHKKLS